MIVPFLFLVVGAAAAAQEPSPLQRAEAGIVSYRAGQYEAAFAEFTAAAAVLGDAAPMELRYDLALAALRVQRTTEADAAARPLAASPDTGTAARGEFLLAYASLQRGERAAAAAQLADSEPMAWESAVRGLTAAHRGFCRAAELRPAWPEALRNAERAFRRLEELRRLRAEAEAKKPPNQKEAAPQPEPPAPAPEPPQEVDPELVAAPLPPTDVARLLARLQQKEAAKNRARQEAQRGSATAGERDW